VVDWRSTQLTWQLLAPERPLARVELGDGRAITMPVDELHEPRDKAERRHGGLACATARNETDDHGPATTHRAGTPRARDAARREHARIHFLIFTM
jgi:hypothetical protein